MHCPQCGTISDDGSGCAICGTFAFESRRWGTKSTLALVALDVALVAAGVAMTCAHRSAQNRARPETRAKAPELEPIKPTVPAGQAAARSVPNPAPAAVRTNAIVPAPAPVPVLAPVTAAVTATAAATAAATVADSAPQPEPDGAPAPTPSAEPDAASGRETPETTTDEQQAADAVYAVIRNHAHAARQCYERASEQYAEDSPLQGRVVAQFTVTPLGAAAQVEAVENTTGSDGLSACMVALIESWSFPSPGPEPMVFQWPFEFQSSR